jgi:hypothetical protein
MRRFALLLTAVVPLTFAVACGDDGGPDGSITGSYTLQTANGNPVPWRIIQSGSDYVELRSGSATLSGSQSSGTYTNSVTIRYFIDGFQEDETTTGNGTWVRSGNSITFTDAEDGETTTGTISGRQITVTSEEEGFVMTLVYVKN